ncbi:hypothetical protein BH23ACT9_BH23ACT9_21770 [soil metagenome]
MLVLVIAIVLGLNQLGLLDRSERTLRTVRVSGADPIAAAASVARTSHGGSVPTVIIAGTAALADGVVATGLAGALNAPILLNEPDRLSAQTRDVVRELDVQRAVLIGGTQALSEAVSQALADELDVEVIRIAGNSRFDTAGQVADLFAESEEPAVLDGLRTALIVPAEDVPAGLEAGSLAASLGNPLPVLISQDGTLPDPTVRAIERLDIEQLLVVGNLTGYDGAVVRIQGPNGAADAAIAVRAFRPPRVVVVPAGDEARTLIAGPLAGREAGVILTADLAVEWLTRNCGTVSQLYVIGEPEVITDLQVATMENAATNCD